LKSVDQGRVDQGRVDQGRVSNKPACRRQCTWSPY
jgi:hypothetical protein